MNVQKLIQDMIGYDTDYRINPLVSQIGTTATKFLKFDPTRLGFIFVNLGSYSIYILNHPSVATTKGIVCTPSGGGKSFIYTEDFILPTEEWYGIASTASNCMCLELLLRG